MCIFFFFDFWFFQLKRTEFKAKRIANIAVCLVMLPGPCFSCVLVAQMK